MANPTYLAGSLSEVEGLGIKWHSPAAEHSSQVFCVSAFGTLRRLPDRDGLFARLFAKILPEDKAHVGWGVTLEHTAPDVLGETGQGTPTNVDAFCQAGGAVVCIESKFLVDAREGFSGCGQTKKDACLGYYGRGSDGKTGTDAACRLEVADRRRDARRYWEVGRNYFLDTVFQPQERGQTCPFAGSNFQLMRNFLLAAKSATAGEPFGVLCMVPEKTADTCREQVARFKAEVLREEHRSRVAVETYDTLVDCLLRSAYDASRECGRFLEERLSSLL